MTLTLLDGDFQRLKMRTYQSLILLLLSYVVCILGGVAIFLATQETESTLALDTGEIAIGQQTEEVSVTPTETLKERKVTIAATGDILIHGPVARHAKSLVPGETNYDFDPMFRSVTPTLQAADLAICHLEVPLSATNTDIRSYPTFRSPYQLAETISSSGYDSCSLASNHSLDAGSDGVVNTLNALEKAGVDTAGTAANDSDITYAMFEVNGVKVAQLSYSYGFNGFDPSRYSAKVNQTDIDAILAEANTVRELGAEIIVLSMHWGNEYITEPTAIQKSLANELTLSPNIDLIIGHHAHVVQPLEMINGKLVIYGLGNFLSNQSTRSCNTCPVASQDGVILNVTMKETVNGFVAEDVSAVPTFVDQGKTWEIFLAEQPNDVDEVFAAKSEDRTLAALSSRGFNLGTNKK